MIRLYLYLTFTPRDPSIDNLVASKYFDNGRPIIICVVLNVGIYTFFLSKNLNENDNFIKVI